MPRRAGHGWKRANIDSDGNHVNVGNFDAKGLNVNNNWDDNRNDNLGVASARQSLLYPDEVPPSAGFFLPLFRRANPSAKHPADFVDVCLKRDVFLVINGFDVFGEADEDTQQVQLHACGF